MIWSIRHIIRFFSLLALTASMPLPEGGERDTTSYIPSIIAPSQETAWVAGASEGVIWSTDNAPPDIDLCTPSLYIVDQQGLLDYVLVPKGFELSAGNVIIIVPNLYTGQYRLQLSCGNYDAISHFFTLYQS